MNDSATKVRTCCVCGFTEADLARTLRIGCAHCYETFGANIETMLPHLHRGIQHVGKRPSATRKLRRELNEIESLLRVDNRTPDQTDALLDRWRAVESELRAACPKPADNSEEASHR